MKDWRQRILRRYPRTGRVTMIRAIGRKTWLEGVQAEFTRADDGLAAR
jgi:hypothetical protein